MCKYFYSSGIIDLFLLYSYLLKLQDAASVASVRKVSTIGVPVYLFRARAIEYQSKSWSLNCKSGNGPHTNRYSVGEAHACMYTERVRETRGCKKAIKDSLDL